VTKYDSMIVEELE